MKIAFRCDADRVTGTADAVACLSVAWALSGEGAETTILANPEAAAAVPALGLDWAGLVAVEAGPQAARAALLARWPGGADALVVAGGALDRAGETAMRAAARRIAALDGAAGRAHDCDLLIDPTPGQDPAVRAGDAPPGATIEAGADYAALSPDWAGLRAAALARRARGGPARRLLVALGRSDRDAATLACVQTALSLPLGLVVDAVVMGDAPSLPTLRRMAAEREDVAVHVEPASIAPLAAAADIAIGGAGSMAIERCAVGLPTLLILRGADQGELALRLAQAQSALIVPERDGVWPGLAPALRLLCGDARRRTEMARRASWIADGRGAGRAAALIAALAGAAR